MATLIRRIYQDYHYINEKLADPRTQDFFLIGTPWPCLGIIAFYFYFVTDLGPNLMMTRKPFKLNRIMQIYNAIQIVVCGFIFYEGLMIIWRNNYSLSCQPIDFSYTPQALWTTRMVWAYFMVKIFDLSDTIFFVLRKKQNHVSVLHLYHHVIMIVSTWIGTKFLPGGQVVFLGVINSFVHVVMYSYYLVTSMGISKPWWKKYITQLQFIQFAMILVQYISLAVTDCGFPRWVASLMIPSDFYMVLLFGEFYYKAYHKQSNKKVVQNDLNGTSEALNGKVKTR